MLDKAGLALPLSEFSIQKLDRLTGIVLLGGR